MTDTKIQIGMEVYIYSPAARRFKERPRRGIVIGGVGIHGPVNNDTGMPGCVTVDVGMGVHEYPPLSWLTPVSDGEPT